MTIGFHAVDVDAARYLFRMMENATCCACKKAPATGVISYAGKVHEPHCEACCKAWEARMLSERFAFTHYALGLADFRAWQADRRRA